MQTQWTPGMAGAVGLRYEALPFVMRLHDVAPEQEREVFGALRVLEAETLELINRR